MAVTSTQLSSVNPTLLPPIITEPIFAKAAESSAIQALARRVPLAVNAQTAIPVPMDVPTADWVGEGAAKPTGGESVGVKIMTGKKLALLLPVSDEVVTTNPAGLYAQLQQDLPTALARAFDHAAIVGKSLRTGNAGPFNDYLAETSQSVAVPTATQANGGVFADLVAGEQLVAQSNYDFSGFVADPRLKPRLKLGVDTTGRPLWVDSPQDGIISSSLIGYPAAYSRGVSGIYRRQGNIVQSLTVNGAPTGGSFTVTIQGVTTTIPEASSAAAVQVLLRAMPIAATQGCTVAGTAPYVVTFLNDSGPGPITVNYAGLTGGTTPNVKVTQAASVDSGLRAIGGDFSQCAYGVGSEISVKVSNQASYVDGEGTTHSAFQENLTLLLIEAYYGFVMGDPNAFVAYTGTF